MIPYLPLFLTHFSPSKTQSFWFYTQIINKILHGIPLLEAVAANLVDTFVSFPKSNFILCKNICHRIFTLTYSSFTYYYFYSTILLSKSYIKTRHLCEHSLAKIHKWIFWEYTVFESTIGLLNLQAVDCPNSVLYDESCKITRKPKSTSLQLH